MTLYLSRSNGGEHLQYWIKQLTFDQLTNTDSGRKAETIQFGLSTISFIFKSTHTEQST